jgi:hypothetical protein
MKLLSFLAAALSAAGLTACTTDGETPNCPVDGGIQLYDIRNPEAASDPAIIAQRAALVREGCASAAGTATGGLVTNPPPGGAGGTSNGGANAGGAAGRTGGGGSGG